METTESAFSRWLDLPKQERKYYQTLTCVKVLGVSLPELYEFLQENQDHPQFADSGVFVSAVLNSIPEKDIVFDLKLRNKFRGLGALLPKEKRLLNYNDIGETFGFGAEGVVVNYGNAGWTMGGKARGLIINLGTRGLGFGAKSRGTLVDFGETRFAYDEFRDDNAGMNADGMMIILHTDQRFIRYDNSLEYVVTDESLRKNEGLGSYVLDVQQRLEEGRDDPRKTFEFLDELGPDPGERIKEDVYRLVSAPRGSLKRFLIKADGYVRSATGVGN